MREDGAHRRVGHVVGRHIDRLDRGDAAGLRRDDAFLQFGHLGKQRRLVADRRRHPAEQARQFAAGLDEAKRVVHQEEHVLSDVVAQVFSVGQRCQADTEAHARRLVHLPEDHQRPRHHAGALHVVPELVPLANPLADAGKDRDALVQLDDRIHEFHDQHGLADAGAAEQPGLAAAHEGAQEIDDLDSGREDITGGGRLRQRRRRRDDGPSGIGQQRLAAVERTPEHVEQAPQAIRRDRHAQPAAAVENRHLPFQPGGPMERDGPHALLVEVAMHLEGVALAVEHDVDRSVQRRNARTEHVNDRPLHFLDDAERNRVSFGTWRRVVR